MERCFVNKDLNPKTCRFVNKCKPDEERDVNFNCRKNQMHLEVRYPEQKCLDLVLL